MVLDNAQGAEYCNDRSDAGRIGICEHPEVEKIFRELLAKCSDDEVKFLFESVEVPERERVLGKERAAKLPPPSGKSRNVGGAE